MSDKSKTNEEATKTDAEIARDQGVSRQAINDRRAQGWSQAEIEAGERSTARKTKYTTAIAAKLGMSVAEKAKQLGVSKSEIYRRMKRGEKQPELVD